VVRRLLLFILVSSSLVMSASAGMLFMKVLAANYTDVSVTEAKTMIDQKPSLVILDVRNQSEYDAGHIRNAKLIPVWQLATRLNELNETDEILVYCRSGVRSAAASLNLSDSGFSHVYNMLGGIIAWVNATYPVYVKYSSIQEAINNATTGDTIRVSSGSYYEHLTINKTIILQGENKDTTTISGSGSGTVVDVTSVNVTIMSFTIQESGCSCADYAGVYAEPSSQNLNLTGNSIILSGFGIRLNNASNVTLSHNEITDDDYAVEITFSSGNSIIGNTMANNVYGFELNPSSSNIIVGNNLTSNTNYDIMLRSSSNNNIFAENEITKGIERGVRLYSSFNNTFNGNLIAGNDIGMDIQNSTGNSLYQNSFTGNNHHVLFYEPGLNNTWDDGNISGGNYWDNYTGVDSNHDGIGDLPHVLDSSNQDSYPLMGMFSTFTTPAENKLGLASNSTLEDLQYFSSNSTIRMHVTNMTENQQYGFCRLTIPHDELSPPYTVTINNNQTNYATIFENATMSIIYFSYQHSTIEIIVIPEYPSFVFLALMGGATLLSLIVYRKKRR
jgi:nitrous oxidase accessory protein